MAALASTQAHRRAAQAAASGARWPIGSLRVVFQCEPFQAIQGLREPRRPLRRAKLLDKPTVSLPTLRCTGHPGVGCEFRRCVLIASSWASVCRPTRPLGADVRRPRANTAEPFLEEQLDRLLNRAGWSGQSTITFLRHEGQWAHFLVTLSVASNNAAMSFSDWASASPAIRERTLPRDDPGRAATTA